ATGHGATGHGATGHGATASSIVRRRSASPAAARLTAIAMPDQLTTQRHTDHGAGGGALGSGFGAPEPIRPATAAGTPGPMASAGAATDVIRSATGTSGSGAYGISTSRPGASATRTSRPGTSASSTSASSTSATRGSGFEPARTGHNIARSGDQPTVARSRTAGPPTTRAGTAAVDGGPAGYLRRSATTSIGPSIGTASSTVPDSGAVLARSYVMAPPRVSMRPTRAPGPPLPASAHGSAPEARSRPALAAAPGSRTSSASDRSTASDRSSASDRSAVYASAAALFRSMGPSAAPPANLPAGTGAEVGSPMSDRVIRRRVEIAGLSMSSDVDSDPTALLGPSARSTGRQLDELADLVIERIEQRVIDELERRGRRGVPGAF
ncbi:MAG: hypothetical protein ACRDWT_12620, partial [Jatrophihabitantaceae bacterium]